MDLRFSDEDEAFRREVRGWLEANLTGEFADARGLGGPGREEEGFEVRQAWERHQEPCRPQFAEERTRPSERGMPCCNLRVKKVLNSATA